MSFILSYPSWFILLCILAGILLSGVLYRGQKKNFQPTGLFWLATGLRVLSVSLLTFLLLSPIIRYLKQKEEKPTLVFLLDESASMKHGFRFTDSAEFRKTLQKIQQELSGDFDIQQYSFGAELDDSIRYTYTKSQTDLSAQLESVYSSTENQNLGAVVLISDGIFNKGNSPLSLQLPGRGSMYTVGIGDTTIQKDALVARLFANRIVYLGDQFAIRSDIAVYGAAGQQVKVSISASDGRIITTQTLNVRDNRFSQSVETIVPVSVAGIHAYKVHIAVLDGEQNTANNSQQVYVEVLDNKESILILAQAPHPDVFALREALTKNKNYKVTVSAIQEFSAPVQDYNLIILHNLPSVGLNASGIIEKATKSGTSLWFIAGAQTAIPLLNQYQQAVQLTARGGTTDAQAILNSNFTFFNPGNTQGIQNLPPLSAPFADYSLGTGAQTLFNQKLGSVSTNYPLWVLQNNSNQRIGVTCGEGLWRWRMYNFTQNKNTDLCDGLITKTAQFLAVKQDKRPFRTLLSKTVYSENEPVVVDAELYNTNYELVNEPDVQLNLIDESGKKQQFNLNKNSNSYSLNLGNLAAGKYQYTASTNWNGKSFSSGGQFTVYEQNIELLNTTADFGMLNQLARNQGGSFLFGQQLRELPALIRKNADIKPILKSEVTTDPLINWKWLFALALVFLGLEWFIRKQSGNY